MHLAQDGRHARLRVRRIVEDRPAEGPGSLDAAEVAAVEGEVLGHALRARRTQDVLLRAEVRLVDLQAAEAAARRAPELDPLRARVVAVEEELAVVDEERLLAGQVTGADRPFLDALHGDSAEQA